MNTVKKNDSTKKFYVKDFLSKCEEIRRKLRICSHLLKKSFTENLISCAVLAKNMREVVTEYDISKSILTR